MNDDRASRIRAHLDRLNGGDLSSIDGLVAPEFFGHVPGPDEPTATRVYRGFAAELMAAAADLRVELSDLAPVEADVLEGVATISGTWTGDLWGAPPTGEHYAFDIPVRIRPIEERFAFEAVLDTPGALAILRRLGLVNPPDQMHLPPPHPVVLDDFLLKLLFTGQVADRECAHLADVRVTRTDATVCEECGPDDIWPALRMCLICGHVGCCDTSSAKHAKAHWEATGHPLIRSIRLDEGWIWCYEDNAVFQRRMLDRIAARLDGAA